MKQTVKIITSVSMPAHATAIGWVRSAKVFHITLSTPVWMVRMLNEAVTRG